MGIVATILAVGLGFAVWLVVTVKSIKKNRQLRKKLFGVAAANYELCVINLCFAVYLGVILIVLKVVYAVVSA